MKEDNVLLGACKTMTLLQQLTDAFTKQDATANSPSFERSSVRDKLSSLFAVTDLAAASVASAAGGYRRFNRRTLVWERPAGGILASLRPNSLTYFPKTIATRRRFSAF